MKRTTLKTNFCKQFAGFVIVIFVSANLFSQGTDIHQHLKDMGFKNFDDYNAFRMKQVDKEHDLIQKVASITVFEEMMEQAYKMANVTDGDKTGFKEMIRERFFYKDRFEISRKIQEGKIDYANVESFKQLKAKEFASYYDGMYKKGQTTFYPENKMVKTSTLDMFGAKLGGSATITSVACNNEDFENTSAATVPGWTGRYGISGATLNCGATTPNPMPTVGFNMGAINSGLSQHTFMTAGNDPVGGAALPCVSPFAGGGAASFRLGDLNDGCEAAQLSKTFLVTSANTNFTYDYAVVMYDGHPANTAPKFTISMTDGAGNPINCAAYTIDATQAANPANGYIATATWGLYYKPWTRVFVPLTNYIGQNVTITFSVSDCNGYAHRGYAYLECTCQPFQLISSSPQVCGGAPTQLTAPGGAATYSWAVVGGQGNIVSGANSQTVTINQGGHYQVTMTAFGSGCSYTIDTIIQGSPFSPTANFTANQVCVGAPTVFTDNSTGNGAPITSWSWNFGDGSPNGTVQNPTHTYATAGTYTVNLTVNNGCPHTYSTTVTVITQPTASFTSNTPCQGNATNFTNTSTNGNTYNWNFNGQGTSTLQNPSFTFPASGTFPVSLTVTAVGGCTATVTSNVTINANPVPAFSALGVCHTTASAFVNNTPAVPAIQTWAWQFGDGNTSAVQSPSNTYAAAGVYTATLTATSTQGCVGTATNTVNVFPNPVSNFSATSVCQNAPTVFTDNSSVTNPPGINDNITTWTWNFGDPASGAANASALQNPNHVYTNCGNSNVVLTVVTNNGCANTSNQNITVYCPPSVPQPANILVCPNTNVAVPAFNPNPATATIGWSASSVITGLPASSGTGNMPNYTSAANNSLAQVQDVITITPTSIEGCVGPSQTFTIAVDPTPFVVPINNITVCHNQMVNVPAFASTPAGASFAWTNTNPAIGLGASGNGNIAGFMGINGTANPNTGQVSVTPTLNGCVGPPQVFTIDISPLPTVQVPPVATYCPGANVPSGVFTSTPAGATYTWVNNNPAIGLGANGSGNQNAFTAGANNTGNTINGVITVTPTLNGCVGPASSYTIGVYPTPVVNAMNDQSNCPNVSFPAVNPTSSPAGATFAWTNNNPSVGLAASGAGSIPTFNGVNIAPTQNIAVVSVTPTLNGCVGPPNTYSITVYPKPVAEFTAKPKVCAGQNMQFTDMSSVGFGTIAQWDWDLNGDGVYNDNTSQNPNPVMNNPGPFVAGLIATSSEGCKDTVIHPLYVNYIPSPVLVADDVDGCPIHTATFTSNSTVTGPASILLYNWNFGNGQTSTSQNPPPQLFNNTSAINSAYYTISLQVQTDSGCTATATNTNYIQVFPKPIAGFTWGPQPPNPDMLDPTVYFIDLSVGANGPNAILWNLGDYNALNPASNITSVQNPTHIYSDEKPGTYYVTQWVENIHGCRDSITMPVVIEPIWTFYIPNAFTPNGDGKNDGFKGLGIGIDNNNYDLWIFDRWGNMVFHSEDLEKRWNGKFQNEGDEIVQEDVYVWKVKFKDIRGGAHEFHGTVSVIK